MLGFIHSYRRERKLRVGLGNALSKRLARENNGPQIGEFRVYLFLAKLNIIARAIPGQVQYSLYANDRQISLSSCNLAICESNMQVAIHNLTSWTDNKGFKFSSENTACICFSTEGGIQSVPSLTVYDTVIPIETKPTLLGRYSIVS